ncbi:hypothetical protein KDA_18070 [Dictyobacter alpinus]|uniref:Protein kinase domain-containing protein n=1 Tax=Dictyobacter alpinus TaxID=2014873 RepID=A0A402B4P3_9CHLR|nr:hypothetical protein [Dictyobacter alpinus]GCE26323.1 hypothetical protein KDA_18070 [Dictyobacter alpinus]
MPERLAYDEAMLFAATRLKIADPDLKQGKVATVTTSTTLGSLERPWGIEGGFAVVYKFITRSGKVRALRCFRVPINQDMRYRYERISAFFATQAPDITVDTHYYADSIVVKEQGVAAPRAYPIIDMQWVDGMTLLEAVDAYCQRHDTAALHNLAQRCLQLLLRMQQCGMAHGDLAGVNIMLGANNQLLLVDYDGVYIPEFGAEDVTNPPGRILLGQPDYQHPQMAERAFNAHMDDFSALVIYTALLALSIQPALWASYSKRDANGKLLDTNLLFTRQDFKEPAQSSLFTVLAQLDHPQLNTALAELQHACQQPINQVRFPEQLMDLTNGQPAIIPVNKSYIPAKRPAASRTIRAPQRELSPQASAFQQICDTEDEEAIAAAFEELSNFGYFDAQILSPAQLQRARLAQQRRGALARFRVALASKRPQLIASAYNDPLLNPCRNVTTSERAILALARAFQQAYNQDPPDNTALIAAYQAIQQSPYPHAFIFSTPEQTRLQTAHDGHNLRPS